MASFSYKPHKPRLQTCSRAWPQKIGCLRLVLQSERQFAIIVLVSIPCAVKISYLFNVAFPKFEKIKKVEWKVCDWTVHLWIQFQATTQNFRIDGKYQKVLISLSPTIKMWKTPMKWKMFHIFIFLFSSHSVLLSWEKKITNKQLWVLTRGHLQASIDKIHKHVKNNLYDIKVIFRKTL